MIDEIILTDGETYSVGEQYAGDSPTHISSIKLNPETNWFDIWESTSDGFETKRESINYQHVVKIRFE